MKKNYIVLACTLVIMICCTLIIVYKFKGEDLPKDNYYQLESRLTNVDEVLYKNTVTAGWIKVQGTNIDYPVVFQNDFTEAEGIDYVWVPKRLLSGENRLAIYGHNIQNVSSEPLIANKNHVRFEQLMSFVDYDFAKENQYIQLTFDGEEYLYKIYAVSFAGSEERGYLYSGDKATDYIKEVKANSLYKYNVDVNKDDLLISLITCTRYFGIDGKTQFKVDARRVREDEKIGKAKVEKTSNYDIIK